MIDKLKILVATNHEATKVRVSRELLTELKLKEEIDIGFNGEDRIMYFRGLHVILDDSVTFAETE